MLNNFEEIKTSLKQSLGFEYTKKITSSDFRSWSHGNKEYFFRTFQEQHWELNDDNNLVQNEKWIHLVKFSLGEIQELANVLENPEIRKTMKNDLLVEKLEKKFIHKVAIKDFDFRFFNGFLAPLENLEILIKSLKQQKFKYLVLESIFSKKENMEIWGHKIIKTAQNLDEIIAFVFENNKNKEKLIAKFDFAKKQEIENTFRYLIYWFRHYYNDFKTQVDIQKFASDIEKGLNLEAKQELEKAKEIFGNFSFKTANKELNYAK